MILICPQCIAFSASVQVTLASLCQYQLCEPLSYWASYSSGLIPAVVARTQTSCDLQQSLHES
jgi:hypothetical protein